MIDNEFTGRIMQPAHFQKACLDYGAKWELRLPNW